MDKKVAEVGGAFGDRLALAQEYGALIARRLEGGTDDMTGGVRDRSLAEARDRAGAATVEAWWWRHHRAAKARYATRIVAVGILCYLAGFLTAAAIPALHSWM